MTSLLQIRPKKFPKYKHFDFHHEDGCDIDTNLVSEKITGITTSGLFESPTVRPDFLEGTVFNHVCASDRGGGSWARTWSQKFGKIWGTPSYVDFTLGDLFRFRSNCVLVKFLGCLAFDWKPLCLFFIINQWQIITLYKSLFSSVTSFPD